MAGEEVNTESKDWQGSGSGEKMLRQNATPKSLLEVLVEVDRKITAGNLSAYVPVPTGFDQIDRVIGGGLQKGDLVLIGGAQGLGKTICALQMARTIAMGGVSAFYISFEHDEEHLLHRLLCLESIDPSQEEVRLGLKMKELKEDILRRRLQSTIGLFEVLQSNPRAVPSLTRLQQYAHHLTLMKGNPNKTNLETIERIAGALANQNNGKLVLFVDYLQKVPSRFPDEEEEHHITCVVEGLKDIALSLNIPVVAVVAADREGLKAKRLRLHHLRGGSALDYECDIALIMNNKWKIVSKDHIQYNIHKAESLKSWVIFSIEKNRAGAASIDVEFLLRSEYFAFNPRGKVCEMRLIDEKIIAV